MVPSLAFVGSLVVDSQRSKFHVADPTVGILSMILTTIHRFYCIVRAACLFFLQLSCKKNKQAAQWGVHGLTLHNNLCPHITTRQVATVMLLP